ncbi:hypothetical protein K1719_010080 [Acacia pycnantha]|nr:hypothetical protein K1719_010080 [Acacia pycnantha]
MFKALYWNNRGSCGPGLYRNLKLLFKGQKPNLLLLADTRCSDVSRLRHLLRLGYDQIRMIPSVGNSGGLVAVWDSTVASISILEEDRQYFHMRASSSGMPDFLLTFIYALPHSNLRSDLWEKLRVLSSEILLPWLVCGDFNDILLESERIGGAPCNSRRINWFQNKLFQEDSLSILDVDRE